MNHVDAALNSPSCVLETERVRVAVSSRWIYVFALSLLNPLWLPGQAQLAFVARIG